MKSKSFTQDRSEQKNKSKLSKSMDFTRLYKTASDTSNNNAENNNNQETPVLKSGKVKKVGKNNLFAFQGATSTPNSSDKSSSTKSKVKPIIKNSSSYESSTETPNQEISPNPSYRKKRNKSVSFRLDDDTELAVKRTKSDSDSMETSKQNIAQKKIKIKKAKSHSEKENSTEINQLQLKDQNKWSKKNKKAKEDVDTNARSSIAMEVAVQDENNEDKKKYKLKQNKQVIKENNLAQDNNLQTSENVTKKKKKKKFSKQTIQEVTEKKTDNPQEVPDKKEKKKKNKGEKPKTIRADAPELSEDLKNLNIGDNAHTLTNLLDEMNVADKSAKIKTKNPKPKLGKMKRKKTNSTSSTESLTIEKLDNEKKEKVKWQKRKWNKDSKSGIIEGNYSKTILVENLPLKMMLNYKKVLLEHFKSCGFIREIGLAEVYPSEDTKPVFTTTITFGDPAAVTKALEEDNSLVEDHRIRVKRPLPPTQTTVVVKSYGEMTEQALSSAFHGAGKIRSIRSVAKGKNTIGTAFVEFDGPETVERAIKMAEETKIGGKKMYASKFEIRGAKKKKLNREEKNLKKSDDSDSN